MNGITDAETNHLPSAIPSKTTALIPMNLTGQQLIGYRESAESDEVFPALDPRNGSGLETVFHEATEKEINEAVVLADSVFGEFRDRLADARAGVPRTRNAAPKTSATIGIQWSFRTRKRIS